MGMWNSYAIEDEEKISDGEAGNVLRRAFRMLRPYRGDVIRCALVLLAWTTAVIAGPYCVKYGIDQGLRGESGAALNRAAVGYAAAAIAVLLLSRTQILLVNRIGERFLRDMRERVFNHLMKMSLGFYDKQQTGKLVARMTSDIDSLQELVQQGLIAFVTSALVARVHDHRVADHLAGPGVAVPRCAAGRRRCEHPIPTLVQ